jgi:TolB-like protein
MKKGRRYRYYISETIKKGVASKEGPIRLPAKDIEEIVAAQIAELLKSPQKVLDLFIDETSSIEDTQQLLQAVSTASGDAEDLISSTLQRVITHPDRIEIRLHKAALLKQLLGKDASPSFSMDDEIYTIEVPVLKRQVAKFAFSSPSALQASKRIRFLHSPMLFPERTTLFLDPALDPAGESVQRTWSRRSQPSLWRFAAALLIFALLAFIGYRVYRNEHVYARQSELGIVDFRDLSGTADASWMGIALQESLSHELSRDGGITAVSGDQIAAAEEDLGLSHARKFAPAELEQLDRRLGVQYLLTGTYLPVGEQVRVDLVLHKGDKAVNEFSETVEQRDLQATIEQASAQMRASLRLPRRSLLRSRLHRPAPAQR